MAGGKGTKFATDTLNLWLGGEVPTPPGTWYVALFNGDPTGAGVEVSGGNYARLSVTNNTTNWPHVATATKKNGVDLAWGVLTVGLGSITHAALFDSLTTGNLGYWGVLTAPQTHTAGNTFTIPTNGAVFTEA